MDNNNKTAYKEDGSFSIDEVLFRPVSKEDAKVLAGNGNEGELCEVKFDVFNSDEKKPKFFGYFDVIFNMGFHGMDNWAYVECKEEQGVPFMKVFGFPIENRVDSRKATILKVAKLAKVCHDVNKKADPLVDKWKRVARMIQQRTPA